MGQSYGEGDWFAIPLKDGGFGIGLIARANRKGVLLGYFFGPRQVAAPSLEDAAELSPEQAILVQRFGHLGLKQKTWPLLGRLDGWDRHQWPVPIFIRHEELTGRVLRVIYDDDDPSLRLRSEPVPRGQVEDGPKDGLMGAGFAENLLSRLLADGQ